MAGGQETGISVRALRTPEECEGLESLQQQIWGFADPDVVPRRLFIVANHTGGLTLGAFLNGRLVGFCLAFAARKTGGLSYWHSHMLGVLPEFRDRGIGRLLKLEQRRYALDAGLSLVEWTFDPLELKNAYFNIERLGVITRTYLPNFYGRTTSKLHAGLPTDRLLAEWWIRSKRVQAKTSDASQQLNDEFVEAIHVPAVISKLRQEDPQTAQELQAQIRAAFMKAFERGLVVTGFKITPTEGIYLLRPWSQELIE